MCVQGELVVELVGSSASGRDTVIGSVSLPRPLPLHVCRIFMLRRPVLVLFPCLPFTCLSTANREAGQPCGRRPIGRHPKSQPGRMQVGGQSCPCVVNEGGGGELKLAVHTSECELYPLQRLLGSVSLTRCLVPASPSALHLLLSMLNASWDAQV